MVTYKQKTKQIARHSMLKRAVELLTTERSSTCCVKKMYVRELYDYFLEQNESREQEEAKKIEEAYIRMWENVHTQYVGYKRVEELTVCYLAGPEPENDFKELISLGVLPHNIWAFESEKNTYLQALQSIDSADFSQPKLIKTSVERFFENTPKVFDIVYIDACSALISEQHALRCIASMFRYHRLASPGILISNFAEIDSSNQREVEDYTELITKYNIVKDYSNVTIVNDNGNINFRNYYEEVRQKVVENLSDYYGEFITAMICNAGSISVPTLRFVNSTYLSSIAVNQPLTNENFDIQEINTIKNNTFYKYLAINKYLTQNGVSGAGIKKTEKLVTELSAGWNGYSLLSCFKLLYNLRDNGADCVDKLKAVFQFFENTDYVYQFLDKPTKTLFIDAVIHQLSCPMHYCSDKIERISYVAKQKRMYMDLIPFDECRYIYDWLPAIDQIQNAFSNLSWQYVFRFALDGLIKQRMNYNNEFFFQGSVTHQSVLGFESVKIKERKKIN